MSSTCLQTATVRSMRSGEGELDVDIEEPLVLFRQEACGERFAKPTGGERHEAKEQ